MLTVSIQSLESDCAQLEKYIQAAKDELAANPNNVRLAEFVQKYAGRVADARADLTQATSLFKQVREGGLFRVNHVTMVVCMQATKYFSEDSNEPSTFFPIFSRLETAFTVGCVCSYVNYHAMMDFCRMLRRS